jgi:hypothetical protein
VGRDRQSDRQTDRQTDRQRQTHKQREADKKRPGWRNDKFHEVGETVVVTGEIRMGREFVGVLPVRGGREGGERERERKEEGGGAKSRTVSCVEARKEAG